MVFHVRISGVRVEEYGILTSIYIACSFAKSTVKDKICVFGFHLASGYFFVTDDIRVS